MASVTRSTRRATNTEGLVQQQLHPVPIPRPHPHPHPLHHPVQAFAAANTNTVTRAANAPKTSTPTTIRSPAAPSASSTRPTTSSTSITRNPSDRGRASRSSSGLRRRPRGLPSPAPTRPPPPTSPRLRNRPPPPPPRRLGRPPLAKARANIRTPTRRDGASPNPTPAPANGNASQLTRHQEKVINGIKHELDRLQPRDVDTHTKEGGRKLRSQEATRFKSELSAYFPEYDEVIGNEPKEQQLFTIDTPIVIFDSNPTRHQPVSWQRYLGTGTESRAIRDGLANLPDGHRVPVRGYGDALFDELVDAQRIDFDFLGISHKREPVEDPLPDATFVSSHKRAERLEKSIRNTERGRAQHEKDQIARLLDGLQGHDWLRVMGVSGVTETRKRQFEPARQHFIKGCQAILDKFRQWSLEEKRRKAEKDRALAEKAEAEDSSEHQSSADSASGEEDAEEDEQTGDISDGDPPGSDDDDDDSVTQQLREEAKARSARTPREFKSFFKKRYERDAALHRHRRAGRKVVAWGHPIPEIPEEDFDLPEEFRDEETLRVHARKKRRDRRGRH
ncbi:IQ calmodulin-binding domain-containing protein [Colletotrichum tofieldiae]|nr:IQ calmodulin-binding domain-containing protein [Colletotrichum tofieldiae]